MLVLEGAVMKISGLDLSSLPIHELSAGNYRIIYQALIKNIQYSYGEIDRRLPEQLVNNLRCYIQMNLPDGCPTVSIGRAFGDSDLNMALCLYMLPERSKDPTIQKYLQIINSLELENNQAIKWLRAQPFSFENITKISKIVKIEKQKLNITGFWERSTKQLFLILSDQLLVLASEKLYEINEQFTHSPLLLATKIIYLIEILNYINKHRQQDGFMVLMDVYQLDNHSLRAFSGEVLMLLKNTLLELEAMPEQPETSVTNSCSLLLLRAASILRNSITIKDPKDAKRVSPDH